MLTYKAVFKFVANEVLDSPGVITSAARLEEARRLPSSALVDMAEIALENGEVQPRPNPAATDGDADLAEAI